MSLTAKNPPAPFPASTTMWSPSSGLSENNNDVVIVQRLGKTRGYTTSSNFQFKRNILTRWKSYSYVNW